ncbi:hypothetical protein GS531_00650 [Rhodococcus hoagii]|nr:hypothetical protein [Prescottella equi]
MRAEMFLATAILAAFVGAMAIALSVIAPGPLAPILNITGGLLALGMAQIALVVAAVYAAAAATTALADLGRPQSPERRHAALFGAVPSEGGDRR